MQTTHNRNDLVEVNEMFDGESLENLPLDEEQEKLMKTYGVNGKKARIRYRMQALESLKMTPAEYKAGKEAGKFKKAPKLSEEEAARELTNGEKIAASVLGIPNEFLLKRDHLWIKESEQNFRSKAEKEATKMKSPKFQNSQKKKGMVWSNIRFKWEKRKKQRIGF